MDEKTAELRELFVETTGEETVTESQADARGSLSSEPDDETVEERLADLVSTMRERYEFASSLSEPDLRRVVRGFFDPDAVGAGADSWSEGADAALADSLDADVDAAEAFRARMDLHLVSDSDREAPFPFARLRRLVLERAADADGDAAESVDDEALAAELADALRGEGDRDAPDGAEADGAKADVEADLDAEVEAIDAETVRRYRRVVEADLASRRANHRFRDAFADLLTDADLSTRLAEDARRDGLKEATEDIETNVSL